VVAAGEIAINDIEHEAVFGALKAKVPGAVVAAGEIALCHVAHLICSCMATKDWADVIVWVVAVSGSVWVVATSDPRGSDGPQDGTTARRGPCRSVGSIEGDHLRRRVYSSSL
jgi:hypothetical protein